MPESIQLVLLPGLDGTGRLFAPLIKALAVHGIAARVIGYPAHESLGYAELERRVRAQLPDARSFVLLAESFSGPIALRIGAAPPDTMKGLILSTTFAARPTSLLGPLAGGVRWARLRPPMFLLEWFLRQLPISARIGWALAHRSSTLAPVPKPYAQPPQAGTHSSGRADRARSSGISSPRLTRAAARSMSGAR